MRRPIGVFLCLSTLLLLALATAANAQAARKSVESGTDRAECKSLKIEYEIKKNSDQSFNVELKPAGGSNPYNYIFLNKDGQPLSSDNSKKEFNNIKSGTYRCIVADRNSCVKELYIEIK